MTGRALAVQGALAAAGLAIAYSTWQREPERAAGEVVIVDTTRTDLANVHYEDENSAVDIRRAENGGESAVWLRILDKTPAPTPPQAKPAGTQPPGTASPTSSTPAAPPPVPPSASKPRPARDLRGDEPAEKLLTQFAPFRSPRAFGILDGKKAKELGLDTTKKKLSITAHGETHDFVIGQPLEGGGENYLRDTKDGRTYLMPRQLLTDLQAASVRLVDRKLHTFKIADVNHIVIAASGKTRDFVIKNREDQNAYKLAPAAAPDKPEEMPRNWHDKVWRLFPTELLGKGETPTAGEPKIAVRVDYLDGTKRVGWLEVGKLDVPPGSEPAPGPHGMPPQAGPEIYGRTEHTAGWVRLRSDPSMLADADKITAGP